MLLLCLRKTYKCQHRNFEPNLIHFGNQLFDFKVFNPNINILRSASRFKKNFAAEPIHFLL